MLFCRRCGPQTELVALPEEHVLRCPGCGETRPLPLLPLFVVTGASGTGKSTIVDALRGRLPNCEVLETDLILHVAELGWDVWRNTWMLVAYALSLNGRNTVLCGSLLPEHLEDLPAGHWWGRSTSATSTLPPMRLLTVCEIGLSGGRGMKTALSSINASLPICTLRSDRVTTQACSP